MTAWRGFLLAFSAAFSHSIIDTLRKHASSRVPASQLVFLVAVLEGLVSFAFVCGQGTLGASDSKINQTFIFAAFMSASLRLLSLLLYQTAITLSPLSTTIPYLSFTPAMLVVTAYLLIGEQPSAIGLVGVCIVTVGGYLLAFSSAPAVSSKKEDLETIERVDSMVMELGYDQLVSEGNPVKNGLAGAMVRVATVGGLAVPESAIRNLQQLGDSKGSVLMIVVAALWSLTSTFDKMGMASAPTLASYLAVQRLMTAAPCIVYLLAKDFTAFRLIYEDFWLMIGLCSSELLTVLLYLWSLKYLFVSYAVAAKRSGILLSVLCGWLFFSETIRDKMFYIVIMMAGMLMIVLAPEHAFNKHLRHP